MGGFIDNLKALGAARIAAIVGVGAAVLALLAWMALRAAEPPMSLLYGDLDARDAGQVVAALERQRVPHRLGAGGSQILVPAEQVAYLRLQLAREGLPAGGTVGYEIFDRGESLTTTPFQQDVNRLRALEGELSRSIRSLHGVAGARVHLVLPRREAFSRDRAEAQASVVLTMRGSQRLDRDAVQAVLHLVATAVPGLRPQNVSIVDSRGELLARGGQALAGPAAAATTEEMRRAQELRLSRAIEEMLERVVGPQRVRAEVSVDLDFDRVQTTEERFDPENQVVRSQQSANETSRNNDGGNTSVANNLPNAENGGQSGSQSARQDETTNFEIGRTTRSITREHPSVRRITAAVLVDGVLEPTQGGEARWRERTPEELQRLAALVRNAIGADDRRGDRVEVVNLRFTVPELQEETAAGPLFGIPPAVLARLGESAIFAIVALIALLLLGRPLVGRISAAVPPRTALPTFSPTAAGAGLPSPSAAAPAALPGPPAPAQSQTPPALPSAEAKEEEKMDAEAMVSVSRIEGKMRASSLRAIVELVDKHPDQALSIVRNWMQPEDAT